MMKRTSTKQVERSQAANYIEKARRFRSDAQNALQLREDFSTNGLAVLCVHAAIAYVDALCIRARGAKAASGDHTDAAALLQDSIPVRTADDKRAVKELRAILQQKDEVSYTARLVRREDAARMLERLNGFAAWAEIRYAGLE